MILRPITAILTMTLVFAACGTGTISQATSAGLREDVRAVREAAESGDPAAATAALDQLRTAVRQGLASGEIDEGRAQRILQTVDEVEGELAALPDATLRDDESDDEEELLEDGEDEDTGDSEDTGSG